MNLKNIVYKKIYVLELSAVFEITFTKEDGRMQFYIRMTNRKQHQNNNKKNTRHQVQQQYYSFGQIIQQQAFVC